MLLSFNIPFGPNQDEAWTELLNAMVHHIKINYRAGTLAPFQVDVGHIQRQMALLWIELPGNKDADEEMFDWLLEQGITRRNGVKCTAARFQSHVAGMKLNLGYWFVDGCLRTTQASKRASA